MIESKRNIYVQTKNRRSIDFLLGIYVVLIGVGLPLVFRDKYFDILTIKYYYYCVCTISMLVILIVSSVLQWNKKTVLLQKDTFRKILTNNTWVDYSVVLFFLIAIISTITSDYLYESFWGNEGRLTGLFLITWYVTSYFCVSRLWKFGTKFIDAIVVSGLLVSLFGISDYFNLDILKFKVSIVDSQRNIFISTVGNINTYTAYIGVIVAISVVLFSTATELKKILFYFISMIIGFCAIIMGVSDNAYISLGVLFAFLPLYLFKDKVGLKRYIIVIATFFSVIQGIGWINKNFSDQVIGIDSSFKLIIEIKEFAFLALILWIIILSWYILDLCKNKKNFVYGNIIRYLWLLMLVILFVVIIYALYDCNIAGNSDRYGKISSYFLFNDDWGTHRGYIWRNAMECYLNLSWWKKLVGFGPETFGILLLQKTANNPYGEVFDSAHNEYLHMLTTVGFIGLMSYLSFIVGIVVRGFKLHINKPYVVAVLFGIICYSVQAFVNLNLPIVTPVFWILLGIGSAKCLEKDSFQVSP